jgi:hypothetical protein
VSSTLIVPLALIGILLLAVWWVYQDARAHGVAGEPVVITSASFRRETPSAWAAVCLMLWVFFSPLYLGARQRTI